MKFIEIENDNINVDSILNFYEELSSNGNRLVIEFTNNTVKYYYNTNIIVIKNLINTKKPKPRPRRFR